jgi:DNA-binding LytR/AlgR family response regulator
MTLSPLRLGLAAWAAFLAATCAYCLTYQAFVAATSPDLAHTLILALREWGAWAMLAPLAMRLFRDARTPRWQASLMHCLALGLAAAALPVLVDQLTDTRDPGASLALFWPRNVAMAFGLLILGRVFAHREVAAPAAAAPRTLLVSKGADQCLIRLDDIQHVTAAGNYVDIRARDQNYLLRATMAEVQALLPEDFIRIHRSHIVRVREIERIRLERSGSGTVRLRGGAELAISKGYRSKLPTLN